MTTQLEQAWELAKQRFAAVGIDVEEALRLSGLRKTRITFGQ